MALLRLTVFIILAVIAQACSNPDPETVSDSEMVEISRALVERSEAMRDSGYEEIGERCSMGFGSRFDPNGEQTVILAVQTYNSEMLYQALSRELGSSYAESEREVVWENQTLGGEDSIRLSAETSRTRGEDKVSTHFGAEGATHNDAMRTAVGDSLRSLVRGLVVANASDLGCLESNS